MIIVFVVLQIIFDLWLLWKIWNYESSRMKLFEAVQRIDARQKNSDKIIIRLQRALNKGQVEIYLSTVCTSCGALLPENTARTHDGAWLCTDCKTKKVST